MKGFELERELSAEFGKGGTGGSKIQFLTEEGEVYDIVKIVTDPHPDGSVITFICGELSG